MSHTQKKPYCSECRRNFTDYDGLRQHLQSVHAPKYRCESCDKDFSNQQGLDSHLNSPKHASKFHCKSCDRDFINNGALEQHKSSVHPPRHNPEPRNREFTNKQNTDTHLNPHKQSSGNQQSVVNRPGQSVNTAKLHCGSCTRYFDNPKGLADHWRTAHASGGSSISKGTSSDHRPTAYTPKPQHGGAPIANHYHSNNPTGDFHSGRRTQGPPSQGSSEHTAKFYCEKCDLRFTSRDALGHHRLTVHAPKPQVESYRGNRDTTNQSRQNHNPTAVPRNNFRCDKCSEDFTNQDALNRHLKSAAHMTKFRCQECNKCYIDQDALDKHFSSAHAPKFYCEKCDKYFPDQYALDQHLVSQAHLITFYCDECERGFPNYESLEKHHKSVHSFCCKQCEREFSNKKALDKHLSSAIHAPQFNCDECSKSFRTKDLLILHAATHVMQRQPKGRGTGWS